MAHFQALLFGPACAPDGLAVGAAFGPHGLLVQPGALSVAADALIVSVGGLDQPALFLNWLDQDGAQWSLKADTAQDIGILLATAPPSLQLPLRQWQRRRRHIGQTWAMLALLAAACLLPLALLWWQAPRMAGALAARIPVSLEVQLGQALLAQLRAQGGLIESGPQQQAVQRIGAALTAGTHYPYRWLLKQDPGVNAFAMPGALIVVHTGLLERTANPTELAAVLAHEVQHVEQRHTLRHLIGQLGWGALVTLTLGDAGSAAAMLAHQAGTLRLSRELEEEADRLGFQALLRANIKPEGMLTFLQKLAREDGADALPDWLSSHPRTAQRIDRVRALIAQQPCARCGWLDLPWPPPGAAK